MFTSLQVVDAFGFQLASVHARNGFHIPTHTLTSIVDGRCFEYFQSVSMKHKLLEESLMVIFSGWFLELWFCLWCISPRGRPLDSFGKAYFNEMKCYISMSTHYMSSILEPFSFSSSFFTWILVLYSKVWWGVYVGDSCWNPSLLHGWNFYLYSF